MNFLVRMFDERFREHRRRSTTFAGMAGGFVAIALFEYRLFRFHVWSWDLLAVALAMVLVKVVLMIWYSLKD